MKLTLLAAFLFQYNIFEKKEPFDGKRARLPDMQQIILLFLKKNVLASVPAFRTAEFNLVFVIPVLVVNKLYLLAYFERPRPIQPRA